MDLSDISSLIPRLLFWCSQEFVVRSPRCPPAEWSCGVCRSASSQTASHKRPGPRSACFSPHWSLWWRKRRGRNVSLEMIYRVCFLFLLTTWKHNSSQKDGERRTVRKKKVGQDAVMSQRELAGGIKCFYYEPMPVEDNGFRVMHCFIL